jgi:hypothetical protein
MSKAKQSIDRKSKPNRFTVSYNNQNDGTYALRNNSEDDEP